MKTIVVPVVAAVSVEVSKSAARLGEQINL